MSSLASSEVKRNGSHEDCSTAQQESSFSNTESESNLAKEWSPSTQVLLIIGLQCFVVFVVSLDMTILVATLPEVGNALKANATQTYWIATSYLLANAACQPTIAALADIWGRRVIYWVSLMLFTVGSIVCSRAGVIGTMLGGRTLQGIGGGGILSVNLIILADVIPLRLRSQYQGYMQLVFSLGIAVAPIIGGALVKVSWRWLFYINLPFCGIGLAAVPFMLKYERPVTSTRQKLSQMDWFGSFLIIVSLTSFLVGISWGGNEYAWSSYATLLPLLLGAAAIAATFVYELLVPARPFLHITLFKGASSTIVYLCTALQSLIMFAEGYFLTLYLLSVKRLQPTVAGAGLLAFLVTIVPISGLIGTVIAKVARYRWAISLGWILTTAGAGALIVLDTNTSMVAVIFLFVFAGIGQGLLFISQSVASQASCDEQEVAYATSLYSFFRSLGCCLGTAIGSTVFQNFLRSRAVALGLDPAISKNSEGVASLIRNTPDSPERQAVTEAYTWAFQRLFAVLTGIAAAGLILSIFVKEYGLNKAFQPKHKLKSAASPTKV